MYQAIIFDFGGVFTASPFEAFARYEREKGLPVDLLKQINGFNHLNNAWARFERGEIEFDEFDKAFADEARLFGGHHVPGRDVVALLAGALRPEVHEALIRIKPHYKTGCITNNMPSLQADPSFPTVYKREVMELFDHVIESSKVGVRKPDPRIYEMMCEALGVQPQACIYLDDLGVNLKPARAIGMHTIKVESGEQAIAELEAATGLKLAPDAPSRP